VSALTGPRNLAFNMGHSKISLWVTHQLKIPEDQGLFGGFFCPLAEPSSILCEIDRCSDLIVSDLKIKRTSSATYIIEKPYDSGNDDY
jgi:hypothetical protein